MEKWYFLVSDYCREACPVVVYNNNQFLSNNFLDGMTKVISVFLDKHADNNVRLVVDDEEIDRLEKDGYTFINMMNNDEELEYVNKYKSRETS